MDSSADNEVKRFRLTKANQADFLKNLDEYQDLEELDLYIPTFPDPICNLKGLRKLKLYSEWPHIESLPESIGNLANLDELHLGFNGLTCLPDSICTLAKLKVLDIHDNDVGMLPADIGTLSHLTVLNLENNPHFTEFPRTFRQLRKLEILKISHSGIPFIPESFSGLASLREFRLNQDQLSECPGRVARALRNQGCKISAFISRRDEGGDSEEVLEEFDDRDVSFWCHGYLEKHLASLFRSSHGCKLVNFATLLNLPLDSIEARIKRWNEDGFAMVIKGDEVFFTMNEGKYPDFRW